jgi:indole-3-pyruvate monooxygenase
MSETRQTNTVIVGAGPAGLAVAACLQRAGSEFVMLEQSTTLASVWRTFYEVMHIHTSKVGSDLPYFAMPASYPSYPSRDQVIAYFESYALHFLLKPEFNQSVRRVMWDENWLVTTDDQTLRCKNLVLATGHNGASITPDWASNFTGTLLHSKNYQSGRAFANQEVLVIGYGNSGHDIVADLHAHGAKVSLSLRNGVNIVKRDVWGIPIARIAAVAGVMPVVWADAVTNTLFRGLLGDLTSLGLTKPSSGVFSGVKQGKIPVLDSGTLNLIKQGSVQVYPRVRDVSGSSITFVNKSSKSFDSCVLATGYQKNHPAITFQLPANRTNGLYFGGFKIAATGVLHEIALEAKRIARAITTVES